MLARLKRFSFISIPNDGQFVKRVSEKNLTDLAILREICSLQAEKTFFHGILGEEQLGGASADEEQLGRCPKPCKGQMKRDEVPPLTPPRD